MRFLIICCAIFHIMHISAQENSENQIMQADSLEAFKKPIVLIIPAFDSVKGRGGSPRVQKCLQELLEQSKDLKIEKFSPLKYRLAGYHQVYDKNYLPGILAVTDADIIIMSKLTVRKWGKGPPDGYWDLDIRFYNTISEEQIDSSLKLRSVLYTEFCSKIDSQLENLIDEILTSDEVAQENT